ncbi:hypothetical protein [Enterobacter cloacae]|uniref:hypothetical protein n=1 Tax=Enterobacter cloacae TaxID=550 RepID=UPI000589053B|nr:hypothetical protein [Enterobacter cloacae]KIF96424.1 hypothetical protein SD66_08425 [Enterobacter cloacae]
MNGLRGYLKISTVAVILFSMQSHAKVYVCERYSQTFEEISAEQLKLKPHDKNETTVEAALNNSNDNGIDNAVKDINGWDICIDPRFWHRGGKGPESYDHLTVFAYKNDEYKTSCHIFSFKIPEKDKYSTSCT